MTISVNNRTYVGIANLTLTRQSDGVVLALPKPASFVVTPGTQQRIQNSRDEQGREVRVRSYITGSQPELAINYAHIQPELISFQIGNQMAVGTFATTLPKLLVVTKGQYSAAASGFLGFGISADPTDAVASITRNNLSFPLTQDAYADYSTWRTDDDKFAIGANGALAFSDNLVEDQEVVAMTIPYSVTGIGLSDIIVGDHKVNATLIDTDNKVTIFEGFSVTPNVDGVSIDPTSEGSSLRFFLNTPPGSCSAYGIYVTNLSVRCN